MLSVPLNFLNKIALRQIAIAECPTNISPAQQSHNLTLHSPTGNRSTEWFFADMSQPRYLTGDRAGIQEFLDKFDVRTLSLAGECH